PTPWSSPCKSAMRLSDIRRLFKSGRTRPPATLTGKRGKRLLKDGLARRPGSMPVTIVMPGSVCSMSTKIDPTAGPDKTGEDYIDWDMWLGNKWGLAPKIPWTPEHFFRFRKYWPYNGGVATDLLYHKLAPLLIALAGPNGAYPSRVNACGGLYVEKDGRDIPDTFLMTADYPNEFSIFLVSTLTYDAGLPDRIYGKYGTLDLGGEPRLQFNAKFKPEFNAR